MDLFEYQGKELFSKWGIPVPQGKVASTPQEAAAVAKSLGGRVVIKAQVQIGGRGKAGGIKVVEGSEEASEAATKILGMDIKGHVVERVLVEKAGDIKAEYYASVMLDRSSKKHLFLVSSKGGMDIEEVAATEPEAIARIQVDPLLGLAGFQVNEMIFGAGLDAAARKGAATLLKKMYEFFIGADASLVEINPLVLTAEGEVVALDAKVSLDDSALFRHPEFESLKEVVATDPIEKQAKERGFSNFIKLEGNVGIIGNGAGLVMSTLDMVDQVGGKASNFLDVGGGADAAMLSSALEVILSDTEVRSVLVNIFGGITRCDLVAQGIVDALGRLDVEVPVVVRLDGTNAEEGRRILSESDHSKLITASTMTEAATKAVEAAR
ncbi:MAG TPA: ADP-forming succinate--CoA ligase subunit beta [Actinomycetota bacterium]|nr:ADP-forming succinate--CoA ligase subunit beta [Actinomycetota bacterium]